ncbi:MAG TPA: hypothetical protein VNU44_14685 [Bryobacteraceae bacterium]|jgi:hypothetical protein|nr:hypothetical protein [Bryobacteraceae bacterium]
MTIELEDATLGEFQPFAVLVVKPPDQLMVHLVGRAGQPGAIPETLATELLAALFRPEFAVMLVKVSGSQASN